MRRYRVDRASKGHCLTRYYDAVLFDLLTALLDSWTLWNAVAGNEQAGRRWRAEYLRITYATGRYWPYEELVGNAAEAIGLPRRLAVSRANLRRAMTGSHRGPRPRRCLVPCTRPAFRSA